VDNSAEPDLLRAAADGDQAAFTRLFRSHQEAVFRFACRMTGSVATAEDLTQECFLRVLRSAHRFDPMRGSLRTYLYAAVRNLALSLLRKQGCAGDAEVEPAESGLEDWLLGKELAEAVASAVGRLPVAQREALVLIEYENLSFEEAARVLDVDAGAVKSRVHRARANLRKMLAPYAASSMRKG
jgi:RNA polymerase sigma-70 factor, ECF subfamily